MENIIHKCDGCRYKGEHQEMGFRPFGVCTRETDLIKAEKAYNADVCPYREEEQEAKEPNILHLFELVKDSGVSVKIERDNLFGGYKIITEGSKCGKAHLLRDYAISHGNSNNGFLYHVIRRQVLGVMVDESRLVAETAEFAWREQTKEEICKILDLPKGFIK